MSKSDELDADLARCPEETGEEVKVMLPELSGVAWFMSMAEVKWLCDHGWELVVSKIKK